MKSIENFLIAQIIIYRINFHKTPCIEIIEVANFLLFGPISIIINMKTKIYPDAAVILMISITFNIS